MPWLICPHCHSEFWRGWKPERCVWCQNPMEGPADRPVVVPDWPNPPQATPAETDARDREAALAVDQRWRQPRDEG